MLELMEKRYNYFYQITNNVNGNFYYGIHSTDNLNDGYMGSGHRLQTAIKLYGIESFTKEIIKFFDTRKELAEYEAEFVTEKLIENRNCYNSILGGEGFNTIGYTACYDKETKENHLVTVKEYRTNPEKYSSVQSGFITAKNKKSNEWTRVPSEEYFANKSDYTTPNSGKTVVKDKNGSFFLVDKNDPGLKNGKYKYSFEGKKHNDETKEKIRKAQIEGKLQAGENNSNFGKKWMHKLTEEGTTISKPFPENIVSEKEKEGWVLGRIITKKVVRKGSIINKINVDELTKEYYSGAKLKSLSEKYGISTSYISKIVRGLRKKSI